MHIMVISVIAAVSLCTTLLFIYSILNTKTNMNNKMSPFECGFEPFNVTRRPFSVRYFILIVLFLIFDVETVLLLPIIQFMILGDNLQWAFIFFVFLLILLSGLLFEWRNNMLDWMN
uniref:NADH-ubiquinone oxidoreductase chain 3 n=1 Tax=Camaena cicatricosa TaxID=1550735 RepID=A0A0A0QQ58_CAMCI|nr:NADH dehydrogenase subunit 3 [Camaena cicatricosa]AIS20798.1 NADH dehydrogenase subunit 3 [Camaena cicatricosa]